MKKRNWNKPKYNFSIAELEQKYKVGKNKIHSNEVWICFLRDVCLVLIIGMILLFTLGFKEVIFGELNIFFKIMILSPFTITLFQFFSPQRLVFSNNNILIKRPFRKIKFIAYSDIKFASILEEKSRNYLRNVLIIVTNDSGLDWKIDLVNNKEFRTAVKRNKAISYNLNKRVLIDFLLHYKKKFYDVETFISGIYRMSFAPIQEIIIDDDISLIKSKKANQRREGSKKI